MAEAARPVAGMPASPTRCGDHGPARGARCPLTWGSLQISGAINSAFTQPRREDALLPGEVCSHRRLAPEPKESRAKSSHFF